MLPGSAAVCTKTDSTCVHSLSCWLHTMFLLNISRAVTGAETCDNTALVSGFRELQLGLVHLQAEASLPK